MAETFDDSIDAYLDKDPRLKAEDKTWAKTFFHHIGSHYIADLHDLNQPQPIQPFLQEQVNEYGTSTSRPASAGVLAAIGRIVRVIAEEAQRSEKVANQESSAREVSGNAGNDSKMLLAGMLAGQGDTSALTRILDTEKVDLR